MGAPDIISSQNTHLLIPPLPWCEERGLFAKYVYVPRPGEGAWKRGWMGNMEFDCYIAVVLFVVSLKLLIMYVLWIIYYVAGFTIRHLACKVHQVLSHYWTLKHLASNI